MTFTNLTNLTLNGWLSFGSAPDKYHSGLFIAKIPVSATEAANTTATEKDTGFTLQAGWVVLDAWLYVNVADSTETVDVGTKSTASGGDADGFINDASLGSTGFVYPTASVTAGGNETYISGNTRGALLSNYDTGSDSSGDHGFYFQKPYAVTSDINVTFTTSNGTDTAAFDIYLLILSPNVTDDAVTYCDETVTSVS